MYNCYRTPILLYYCGQLTSSLEKKNRKPLFEQFKNWLESILWFFYKFTLPKFQFLQLGFFIIYVVSSWHCAKIGRIHNRDKKPVQDGFLVACDKFPALVWKRTGVGRFLTRISSNLPVYLSLWVDETQRDDVDGSSGRVLGENCAEWTGTRTKAKHFGKPKWRRRKEIVTKTIHGLKSSQNSLPLF